MMYLRINILDHQLHLMKFLPLRSHLLLNHYYQIPHSHRWNHHDLRKKFQQTMPGKVDVNYLQTVLDVGEGHAKNLIPQMATVMVGRE